MINRAIQIIQNVAASGLKMIRPDGSMAAGHNGPYNDQETPVRNTGHWLIIFSTAFKITGEEKYRQAVKDNAEYIFSRKSWPGGFSFFCRLNPQKDKCNGLIGQAWVLEALQSAVEVLEDKKYEELGLAIIAKHRFNKKIGLWHILEIDGKILEVDKTFNHQLWFAATSYLIGKNSVDFSIKKNLVIFFDSILKNIIILDNGLILHPIKRYLAKNIISSANDIIRALYKNYNEIKEQVYLNDILYKSIGYHSFNMFAFAMLKEAGFRHKFFSSSQFKSAVNYMRSDAYLFQLDKNKYSYPYNPSGFEIPFVLSVFGNGENEAKEISRYVFKKQINSYYSQDINSMSLNTDDSSVLTARIYELSRLIRIPKR